jgi:PAS domain S-box-containing protein
MVLSDMTKEIIPEKCLEESNETALLRRENALLEEQLKHLIKVENRLYEYQQELDSQLKEYQRLYELSRKFNRYSDIKSVFENAMGFIINDLEYERAIIFEKSDESGAYEVCSLDGFYEAGQKHAAAGAVINAADPFISPILGTEHEYLICRAGDQGQTLDAYRSKLLMNEFLIFPIGPFADTPALLVIGNSSENSALFRKIGDGKGELLGVGNLVGLVSSTMENQIAKSRMVRAQDQERIAEARYCNIFENAVEGIFQAGLDGQLLSANPSMAALLGYDSPEELINSVNDFLADICLEPAQRVEMLRLLLKDDRLLNFEIQLVRKNGSRLWALLNARVARDAQGDYLCMEGFLTDISERKEWERALLETWQFLDKIINSIADPIFVKDKKFRWVLMNDACCTLLKRQRREMLGKTDYDLFLKEEADSFRKSDRLVLGSGKEHVNEGNLTDASGGGHTIITKKALYRDGKKGKFIVGILRDVTTFKQTSEALRKSEEMLANVLANFPGVVFWKDAGSVYIGCNKNFSNGAGLSGPSEIVGKTDYDLPWALSEADSYRADDRQVMESRIPKLNIIETQLQSDGKIVWYDTSKVPLYDSNGDVIGVLGLSNNITERKLAEESLLIAREELVRQEKLAILGRLSGSVSHELRNPLGIINNAVYLLKLMHPEADEKTREYLGIIKHEIDNSLHIITGLLDFARSKPPQAKPVKASRLIEASLKKCAIPNNVTVVSTIPPKLPLLMVDPRQMEQVLHNLIINSIQAMPDGGSLCVSAQQVQGSEFKVQGNNEQRTTNSEPNANFVELSVKDSGEGIKPEHMEKLFQPLFTTKPKGIGLGLVVCKNLVEGNGGRIEVTSELGRGSIFRLILPLESGHDSL